MKHTQPFTVPRTSGPRSAPDPFRRVGFVWERRGVWGYQGPAGSAGTTGRREDRLLSVCVACLPFFLGSSRCGSGVFDSEERPTGPKARASPRADGRKPRLLLPRMNEQGWCHLRWPPSSERGWRCPHRIFPLELCPGRHFEA